MDFVVSMALRCCLLAQTDTGTKRDYARFREGHDQESFAAQRRPADAGAAVRTKLFDTSSAYLWALAQDSKGNLYAGGGRRRQALPHSAGRQRQDAGRFGRAADPRHRRRFPGPRLCRHLARRQDLPHTRRRQSRKSSTIPRPKYIWAHGLRQQAATCSSRPATTGEIHRVTPDGKGKVFFKTDETHVRSMALDASGNLIVGTDPGGLVLRVAPCRRRFRALPDAQGEVTAVAVAHDGSIYAAGVGSKTRRLRLPPPPRRRRAHHGHA